MEEEGGGGGGGGGLFYDGFTLPTVAVVVVVAVAVAVAGEMRTRAVNAVHVSKHNKH